MAIVFGFVVKKNDKFDNTSPIMCSAIFAICVTALVLIIQHSSTLDKGFLIAYGLIAALSFLLKFG